EGRAPVDRAGRAAVQGRGGAAEHLLELGAHPAQVRGGDRDGVGGAPHGGAALLHRPRGLRGGLGLRAQGGRARRRRPPLRPREDREPRGRHRGDPHPRRLGGHLLRGHPPADHRREGGEPGVRHRRPRALDRREPRRGGAPAGARGGDDLAGARGGRRAPAHGRPVLHGSAGRPEPRPLHGGGVAGPGHRPARRGRDRGRGPADHALVVPRAHRRDAPRDGARRHPRGRRRLRPPGRRRLPQAPRAPRRRPALRRHARPVPVGHDARGRPPHVARAPGRDPAPGGRRRRAHPPRARGSRGARDRDQRRL
ncbi:MAG: Cobalt-zinc-cadmium resistance protein, partial [uncultured Solirubrobacteraceae bacterium]